MNGCLLCCHHHPYPSVGCFCCHSSCYLKSALSQVWLNLYHSINVRSTLGIIVRFVWLDSRCIWREVCMVAESACNRNTATTTPIPPCTHPTISQYRVVQTSTHRGTPASWQLWWDHLIGYAHGALCTFLRGTGRRCMYAV